MGPNVSIRGWHSSLRACAINLLFRSPIFHARPEKSSISQVSTSTVRFHWDTLMLFGKMKRFILLQQYQYCRFRLVWRDILEGLSRFRIWFWVQNLCFCLILLFRFVWFIWTQYNRSFSSDTVSYSTHQSRSTLCKGTWTSRKLALYTLDRSYCWVNS